MSKRTQAARDRARQRQQPAKRQQRIAQLEQQNAADVERAKIAAPRDPRTPAPKYGGWARLTGGR